MACVAAAAPHVVAGSAGLAHARGSQRPRTAKTRGFQPDGPAPQGIAKKSGGRLLEKSLESSRLESNELASSSRSTPAAPLPLPAGAVSFPLRFLWFRDEKPEAATPAEAVSVKQAPAAALSESSQIRFPLDQGSMGELDVGEASLDAEEEEGTMIRRVQVPSDGFGRWSAHMQGFHSLWRGLRGRLRAAEAVAPASSSASAVTEEQVAEPEQEEPCMANLAETKKANAWALSALLNWKRQQVEENVAAVKGCSSCESCMACTENGVSSEGVCSGVEFRAAKAEAPRVQVAHTQETYSEFLAHASVPELRTTALLSRLCDLAYEIPELTDRELSRQFHLHLTATSLELKAAAAREAALREAEAEKHASAGSGGLVSYIASTPNYAFAAAAAVGSYIQPAAAMAASYIAPYIQKKQQQEKEQEEALKRGEVLQEGSTVINVDSLSAPIANFSLSSDEGSDEETGIASFEENQGHVSDPLPAIAASLVTSSNSPSGSLGLEAVPAQTTATEPAFTCPCEWYICDDDESHTRYFIIQGSDSLASWQTNLSFEPVVFETPDLGVLVHKGIYEAAQGLYEELLPFVRAHVRANKGADFRFRFAGHSLGGSLATCLSLMLQIRGELPKEHIQPVYTFGSPSIMCGGDHLLEELGLPLDHVLNVVMHRDIVPRAFACDYPDHVAEVLRRVGAGFRDHPCLLHQRLLYAPMGVMMVLQPDQRHAPRHPLLPSGSGLWKIRHPEEKALFPQGGVRQAPPVSHGHRRVHVRAAQRSLLNMPHPLEILSDPGAYGNEGSISRDHDPRNYTAVLNALLRQETRRYRRMQRDQRRKSWWTVVGGGGSGEESTDEKAGEGCAVRVSAASARLRPIKKPVTADRRVVGVSGVKRSGMASLQTWGG